MNEVLVQTISTVKAVTDVKKFKKKILLCLDNNTNNKSDALKGKRMTKDNDYLGRFKKNDSKQTRSSN